MGQRVRKKNQIFHHFDTLRPSQKRLKIEEYKQRTEKRFIPPLSNCRMCMGIMGPSLTGFYRVGQKLSDIIRVLRITPRATEPSPVSVFLSIVKCGRACRAQTCAHFAIEPSTLAKWFLQGGPKTFQKSEFLSILRFYVPITQQQLQIEAYDPSQEKILVPPLSICRIYIGVFPTAFYRLGQKVSDTIPILRITAIAPEPTTVSVCSERRQVRSNM